MWHVTIANNYKYLLAYIQVVLGRSWVRFVHDNIVQSTSRKKARPRFKAVALYSSLCVVAVVLVAVGTGVRLVCLELIMMFMSSSINFHSNFEVYSIRNKISIGNILTS